MAFERAEDLAGGQVPEDDGVVLRAAGQVPAVGRERDRPNQPGVAAAKPGSLLEAGQVPQANGAIAGAGGQRLAVGRKGGRANAGLMAFQAGSLLTGDQV